MPRKKETGSEKVKAPENKPVQDKTGGTDSSGEKPDESKSDNPGEQKDSDSKPAGERPSPVNKESQKALEKKEVSPSEGPRKVDGEKRILPKTALKISNFFCKAPQGLKHPKQFWRQGSRLA